MPARSDQPITAAEARRLDLNSVEHGVGLETLMQNAGKALARFVAARGTSSLFFCGRGNNGGDGLAAAAELQRKGHAAWVVLADSVERLGGLARIQLERLEHGSWTVWRGKPPSVWNQVEVLVDCLLGTGQRGAPRGRYANIVRYLNRRAARGAFVVACDVPTGLGSPLAVRPRSTVTLHARKIGMTRANSGVIHTVPIGIPRAAHDVGMADLDTAYVRPRPGSHKGDNGSVLVVGGGPYSGAPHYVGMSAYRTGADLVHAAIPGRAAKEVASWGPDLLVHALDGDHLERRHVRDVAAWMDSCTAVVLGPGLGRKKSTREAAAALLDEAAKRGLPIVVDADGLDALTSDLMRRHGHRMVLTPHSKEFADLAGVAPTEARVRAYAKQQGVTVVWKHQGAYIASPSAARRCTRGHVTMTVGGTGDVLAGAIGELLAKGAAPFDAACAGAYLVGVAGEIAATARSYGATATDVLECIPAVLLRLS